MGQFLARFGAKIYISRIMGLSLFREMGPVLTALMIGARVGAGITAELGSMKVTEQIDAMRALATSPVKKLVVPRVLATVLMLPVLTVISDAVGLVGGLLIAVTQLGLGAGYFFSSMAQNTRLGDLTSGLGKAVFFGFLISIIACNKGLGATGGADGVGRATTSAVVAASIGVLVSDFFLTKLFMAIGSKDESRPYISVRGLYKSFNGKPVLQGVDFDVTRARRWWCWAAAAKARA